MVVGVGASGAPVLLRHVVDLGVGDVFAGVRGGVPRPSVGIRRAVKRAGPRQRRQRKLEVGVVVGRGCLMAAAGRQDHGLAVYVPGRADPRGQGAGSRVAQVDVEQPRRLDQRVERRAGHEHAGVGRELRPVGGEHIRPCAGQPVGGPGAAGDLDRWHADVGTRIGAVPRLRPEAGDPGAEPGHVGLHRGPGGCGTSHATLDCCHQRTPEKHRVVEARAGRGAGHEVGVCVWWVTVGAMREPRPRHSRRRAADRSSHLRAPGAAGAEGAGRIGHRRFVGDVSPAPVGLLIDPLDRLQRKPVGQRVQRGLVGASQQSRRCQLVRLAHEKVPHAERHLIAGYRYPVVGRNIPLQIPQVIQRAARHPVADVGDVASHPGLRSVAPCVCVRRQEDRVPQAAQAPCPAAGLEVFPHAGLHGCVAAHAVPDRDVLRKLDEHRRGARGKGHQAHGWVVRDLPGHCLGAVGCGGPVADPRVVLADKLGRGRHQPGGGAAVRDVHTQHGQGAGAGCPGTAVVAGLQQLRIPLRQWADAVVIADRPHVDRALTARRPRSVGVGGIAGHAGAGARGQLEQQRVLLQVGMRLHDVQAWGVRHPGFSVPGPEGRMHALGGASGCRGAHYSAVHRHRCRGVGGRRRLDWSGRVHAPVLHHHLDAGAVGPRMHVDDGLQGSRSRRGGLQPVAGADRRGGRPPSELGRREVGQRRCAVGTEVHGHAGHPGGNGSRGQRGAGRARGDVHGNGRRAIGRHGDRPGDDGHCGGAVIPGRQDRCAHRAVSGRPNGGASRDLATQRVDRRRVGPGA